VGAHGCGGGGGSCGQGPGLGLVESPSFEPSAESYCPSVPWWPGFKAGKNGCDSQILSCAVRGLCSFFFSFQILRCYWWAPT
jgi:hypothetical protein